MDISKSSVLQFIKESFKYKKSSYYFKKKFEEIAEKGFDMNTKFENGKTFYHYVIENKYISLIKVLKRCGVNPNICDDKFVAPLHLAVSRNNATAIKKLLQIGSDINVAGEFEQTPLHLATILGNLKIIKLLIKYHADIELVDEKNLSVIEYAKDEKNQKIIEYLKKYQKGEKNGYK